MNNPDRFSWSRVALLYRTFAPRTRRMLVTYPLVSAFAVLLCSLIWRATGSILTFTIVQYLQYLAIFAPLALAIPRGNELLQMLPVRNSERITYCILFYLVLIPLLVFGTEILLETLLLNMNEVFSGIPNQVAAAMAIKLSSSWVLKCYSTLTIACSIITCLTTVIRSRKNQIGKAIIYTFLFSIVNGFLLGGIISIIGFEAGFEAAVSGAPLNVDNFIETSFLPLLIKTIYFMFILLFVYFAAMLVLFIRSFSTRQM